MCKHCGSAQLVWEPVSGMGTLASWCTFHQKYYQVIPVPYDTILVQLDEGPFFVSNPEGFQNSAASLGLQVRVAFKDCEDDAGPFKLPVFELLA
jgi:uncharacterized OB-fold protein